MNQKNTFFSLLQKTWILSTVLFISCAWILLTPERNVHAETSRHIFVSSDAATKSTAAVTDQDHTIASKAKPSAPKNLKLKQISLKRVALSWKAVSGAAGYTVYEKYGNENWYRLGSDKSNEGEVTGLFKEGLKVSYRVRAYNSAGQYGPYSKTVSIKIKEASKKISLVQTYNQVNIDMKHLADGDEYYIYRRQGTKGKYVNIATLKEDYTFYLDKNVKPGYAYYYKYRVRYRYNNRYAWGRYSSVAKIKVKSYSPPSGPAAASPRYRALLIGNGWYGDSGYLIAHKDLQKMYMMLASRGKRYDTVWYYMDIPSDKFEQTIYYAFNGATKNDVSVFYYSGHGLMDDGLTDEQEGALCMTDGYYWTFSDIKSILDQIPGKKILLLDSCNSGAAIKKSIQSKDECLEWVQSALRVFGGGAVSKSGAGPTAAVGTGEFLANDYVVLAACEYHKPAWENNNGSLFARSVVTGCGYNYLNGGLLSRMKADSNQDGTVTVSELYTYVYHQCISEMLNKEEWYTGGAVEPQRVVLYPTGCSLPFVGK